MRCDTVIFVAAGSAGRSVHAGRHGGDGAEPAHTDQRGGFLVAAAGQAEHPWFQGCLYNQETNQETNEQPQRFFDHRVKEGDAYQLAQEIRSGLDLTRSK